MNKKIVYTGVITLICLLVTSYNCIFAEIKEDFLRFVSIVKEQTINKVPRTANIYHLSPGDNDSKSNIAHCNGMSTANTTKQTSEGLLTCLPNYQYQVKDSRFIYTYDYRNTNPESKLKLVTTISSKKYPVGYYAYSYPEGNLKSAVIEFSDEKKMLFEPDGSMLIYSSPGMCIQKTSKGLSQVNCTYDWCKTMFKNLLSRTNNQR